MLEKVCSVCGTHEKVDIETVTNVAPRRDDMFPVLLCAKHKTMLIQGALDIRLNEQGNLVFIVKKGKASS